MCNTYSLLSLFLMLDLFFFFSLVFWDSNLQRLFISVAFTLYICLTEWLFELWWELWLCAVVPFLGRPHLQVLVYWLCELPPDTAAGHAVHVSIEPHGGGRPAQWERCSSFLPHAWICCDLKSPSIPLTYSNNYRGSNWYMWMMF